MKLYHLPSDSIAIHQGFTATFRYDLIRFYFLLFSVYYLPIEFLLGEKRINKWDNVQYLFRWKTDTFDFCVCLRFFLFLFHMIMTQMRRTLLLFLFSFLSMSNFLVRRRIFFALSLLFFFFFSHWCSPLSTHDRKAKRCVWLFYVQYSNAHAHQTVHPDA